MLVASYLQVQAAGGGKLGPRAHIGESPYSLAVPQGWVEATRRMLAVDSLALDIGEHVGAWRDPIRPRVLRASVMVVPPDTTAQSLCHWQFARLVGELPGRGIANDIEVTESKVHGWPAGFFDFQDPGGGRRGGDTLRACGIVLPARSGLRYAVTIELWSSGTAPQGTAGLLRAIAQSMQDETESGWKAPPGGG